MKILYSFLIIKYFYYQLFIVNNQFATLWIILHNFGIKYYFKTVFNAIVYENFLLSSFLMRKYT